MPLRQQAQCLLVKPGLLDSQSTVPRRRLNSHRFLAKLDLFFRCRANGTNSIGVKAGAMPAGGAQPPGIAKQSATTKPGLAKSSGEAGSPWSRAGGTTQVVEVPKILCQGKVEVIKNIPQERNFERMEKQSRVFEVPRSQARKTLVRS